MLKSWKVIGGLLAFWLVIMIYMSNSLMQGGEINQRAEQQLRRALDELDKVKAQNLELQQLAADLKQIQEEGGGNQDGTLSRLQQRLHKANQEIQRLVNSQQGSPGKSNEPTADHEKSFRKVENTAVEFWYFMRSQLKKIKDSAGGNTEITSKVDQILGDGANYQRTLRNDFDGLRNVDGMKEWRDRESMELGDIVQRRLHYLQNPKDCGSAKKIVCNLHKGCGYGCQLHHVVYCLIVAYATERTLVLESKSWRYAPKGWETVFQPLSNTCNTRSGEQAHHWGPATQIQNAKIVELPIVDSMHPRPDFMPLAIPQDLAPRLLRLHGDPPVWWIGQFVKYLTRPQPHLKEDMERTKKALNFKSPIVGVHVRRTDKVGVEAAFHGIDEYMEFVNEYFDRLEAKSPVEQRRIYLATDDANLLREAREKYPTYQFISDNDISKTASLGTRYSDSSLRGVILDIHFLSMCDYLVCTFSSQVCRVAYEVMQTMHGDASAWFKSLDDVYYFGGQNAHNMRALETHEPKNKHEIKMEVDDLMGIAGNHWDGFSKGVNRRSGQSGLYPSYKVKNEIAVVKFPTYPEAEEVR
ncbi:alpha-(1,6)-fucosyltransferase-like [Haliotis rufescens]|uniref:alpha-(1,6)-fucosyltransferase-like n=1 Tax=Haliotis rufescens TaxID=6454 RepID=UPI001EB0118E|nr:alpha-(1,6)-fucosyltransferase-like [Haliotis rufescens]XP_046372264.1 alpha-(1,6)-fucosyltransferase-like [Haliotis rufescens]XP_048258820.1 alpha-(1,6)-fucosyltransferase-like [Haliotis rufescens]XP_048258821.1 alpha-(1,6)-fucosyltransferase-like [Haliotis rufescens]